MIDCLIKHSGLIPTVSVKEQMMAKIEVKRRMKNLLMFLPNMIALCGRLMTDRRVPRTEKLLFAGAIVYAVMPLDFIPDMLPFIGQVDDAYLIALTLIRLINRTDTMVVREHWRGGGDIVQLTEAVAGLAPKLLPQRIERVLSARVEEAPQGRRTPQGSAGAMLVELPGQTKAVAETR
jgi:uncharacterized membrane protein YkvA (DUF1232 family)